jgi:hypothetical protein
MPTKDPNSNTLESLPNVGKTIAKELRQIGINNKSEFMAQDPYQVFQKLVDHVNPDSCRCMLASIVGAHEGLPWHKMTKQTCAEWEKRNPGWKWNNC